MPNESRLLPTSYFEVSCKMCRKVYENTHMMEGFIARNLKTVILKWHISFQVIYKQIFEIVRNGKNPGNRGWIHMTRRTIKFHLPQRHAGKSVKSIDRL